MAQQADSTKIKSPSSLWAIGRPGLVYIAVGTVLYGLFSWATSGLKIPGPFNSSIRPGVSIPLFFGVAFGPVVGFLTGFLGNVLGDLLSGSGFVWNWSLGNGLMGLIAGLAGYYIRRLNNTRSLSIAVVFALLGILVGIGFASLTDMWVDSYTLDTAWTEFYQIVISDAIAAVVLVPLLSVAYESLRTQSGP
jgi:energy-coupling factor transport system substrate-specific component